MKNTTKETVKEATNRYINLLEDRGYTADMLEGFDLEILVQLYDSKEEYKEAKSKEAKSSITTLVYDMLKEADRNQLPYSVVYEAVRDYKCQQSAWFGQTWSDVKTAHGKYLISKRFKLENDFDIKLYNKVNQRVKANIASHITHVKNDSTSNNTLNKLVNKEGKEVKTIKEAGLTYIKLVTQNASK